MTLQTEGEHWTPGKIDNKTFNLESCFSKITVIERKKKTVAHWGKKFKSECYFPKQCLMLEEYWSNGTKANWYKVQELYTAK